MRIIIAMTQIPFITGGAEFLAMNLGAALKKAEHEVEFVNIPMYDNPVELLERQILAVRLLEIEKTSAGFSDLCIGLKFPAYYIQHSNKVAWVLHQYRHAYDLWGTEYGSMQNSPEGSRIRNVVYNADNLYLQEAKQIYTISKNVTGRMEKFNNIASTPLYHPCPDMDKFYCDRFENYILMPSRINATKRQRLVVEAMAQTKSDIKLYVLGRPDHPSLLEDLQNLIKERKLENRVELFDFVSQEEKIKLYANARAVMFIPYDEDYGYITLEGMSASKAVITATDSGGALEFIENDKTGLIVDPNSADLAKAIDMLANSASYAMELGAAAKKHISDMDITWENVVKELTK